MRIETDAVSCVATNLGNGTKTVTTELIPEQRRFVEERLETGEYSSESASMQHQYAAEMLQRRQEKTAETQRGYQRGYALPC